jgi:hypothetical protein
VFLPIEIAALRQVRQAAIDHSPSGQTSTDGKAILPPA